MRKEIIILIPLLFFLMSGCTDSIEEHYEIEYTLVVELNSSSQYNILVPLPITAPAVINNISKIISELKFTSGSGKYTIEESTHGKVLNVSSNQSLILTAEKKYSRSLFEKNFNYTFVALTTEYGNASTLGPDYYFFFNNLEKNVIKIKFSCYTKRMSGSDVLDSDEWNLEVTNVQDGWNSYPIKEE